MIEKILKTDRGDWGALIARVFLGVVILPHGLQKLLGLFGGYGFSATVEYFSSTGIPGLIGVLIVLAESFGALFLIAGLLSRISAAGIALIMLGAIVMIHSQFGFFMNWFGAQAGEGFEYHLLALGLALVVIVKGGGKWALDGEVSKMIT
ncbi:MAG: DoxX family protein [Candidatus Dadabacteria bacterium]|nr:DoxX family protein [Candidatus Dadabacteria bacterium]TDI92048.1 MAG: DoxX family protein [Candidatus Dadabacteria bacterium]TDJ00309.1 MAG: DoxX family protein [Candidatus Dadabacteria bacterium]